MNAGRIEQAGPPDVVYRRPASRFVADFIGRANFLTGRVLGVVGDEVDVSLLGVPVRVPAGGRHGVGSQATVVVRPESIRVGTGGLRAGVRGSTFLGSYVEYELQAGDDVVLAIDGEWMTRGLHAPGEEVAWSLAPERAYALPA